MAISYGAYNFPNPRPSVVLGDEPIYVAGALDSLSRKISLIGNITGSNLASLSLSKKQMNSGLLSQFETLNIEGEVFQYCKPISLSFSESDLTTILPYSIEFECYQEKPFSEYFGVLEPVNVWNYQEQDGRIVQASHTVSARGIKTSSSDPFELAKNFVDVYLNGFENLSVINDEIQGVLTSKTEEINRFNGSYSITENYLVSTSRDKKYNINNSIVSANTQINYVKNGESSISVNGSILGSVNGPQVNKEIFGPSQAEEVARQAIENSRSSYEDDIYGLLINGPNSYNYNINETENKIDFSFDFREPFSEIKNGILHQYSVSISAEKDSNNISCSIEGELTYVGAYDFFTGASIENSPRYLKILSAFNELNIYALAQKEYSDFLDVITDYESSKYLNEDPTQENITKNPYTPVISYSYVYDNRVDYSNGDLKNFTFQITDSKPIMITETRESNAGFASQETYETLGKIQISSSSDNGEDKLNTLKDLSSGLLYKKCHTYEENWTTEESKISYQTSSYYS